MPRTVAHPVVELTAENELLIPLAVDEDGNTIYWDLRRGSRQTHLLVTGSTGTGKTVVITGAVLEAARRGWNVRIIDPKRTEFVGLRDWPNIEIVATQVRDQVAVVYRTWEEMERRYDLLERGEAVQENFEPIVLVLDEFRSFARAVTEWYAGVKQPGIPVKCPVFEKVADIARKGRTGRIHLIVGTQRPDADFTTGEMRDNFSARMSLGPLSVDGAKMMWENYSTGVSVPRKMPGRGTGVGLDDKPVEIQAYWTPDPRRAARKNDTADLQMLEALRPTATLHPAAGVVYDPELMQQCDDKGNLSGEWQATIRGKLVLFTALEEFRQVADSELM